MGHYANECSNVHRRMRLYFATLVDEEEIEQFAHECSEEDLTVLSAFFMNTNYLQVNPDGVTSGVATSHRHYTEA